MELWQDTPNVNSQVPDKKLAGALRTTQINYCTLSQVYKGHCVEGTYAHNGMGL